MDLKQPQESGSGHDRSSHNPLLSLIPRGLRHLATGELLDKLESWRREDRLEAVRLLSHPTDEKVAVRLAQVVVQDKDQVVQYAAASALSGVTFPKAIEVLCWGVRSGPSAHSRIAAITALKESPIEAYQESLAGALRSEQSHEVLSALPQLLRAVKDQKLVQNIIEIIKHGQPLNGIYACYCLADHPNEAAIDILIETALTPSGAGIQSQTFLFSPGQRAMSRAAAQSLWYLKDETRAERLISALDSSDSEVREHAVIALSQSGIAKVREKLIDRLKVESSTAIRMAIALALGPVENTKPVVQAEILNTDPEPNELGE